MPTPTTKEIRHLITQPAIYHRPAAISISSSTGISSPSQPLAASEEPNLLLPRHAESKRVSLKKPFGKATVLWWGIFFLLDCLRAVVHAMHPCVRACMRLGGQRACEQRMYAGTFFLLLLRAATRFSQQLTAGRSPGELVSCGDWPTGTVWVRRMSYRTRREGAVMRRGGRCGIRMCMCMRVEGVQCGSGDLAIHGFFH